MPAIEQMSGWLYWIALLAALVETVLVVGLFLPGSTLLLLLGAFSANPGGPSFFGILVFAVAGATLGDNINFTLGRRYGRRWMQAGVWLLRREHFEKAQDFFSRHGGKSVFLSRFVPSLKEVAPFVAGSAGMNHVWFFVWNLFGALGWGLQWVGVGFVFARSLSLAQLWLSRTGLAIGLFVIALLLLWYLRRTMLRYWPRWWASAVSVSRSLAQAIRENPEAQAWAASHPRVLRLLGERLDRGHFKGLPLTLLCGAFAYLLLLFGGLIEDVVTSDPIVALDHSVAEIVATVRSPHWIAAAVWISGLGAWPVVLATLAAVGIWFWNSGRRSYVLPLLASVGGSVTLAVLGKLALHRARPPESVVAEMSYAFPSAHATLIVSLYGLLAYVWIRETRSWPTRVNVLFLWAIVSLLVGTSRIVLGVHYLSDVLGGYLLGGLWLLAAIAWSEWASSPPAREANHHRARLWAMVGVICVVGVFVVTGLRSTIPTQPPAVSELVSQQMPRNIGSFLRERLPHYVNTALGARAQPLSLALLVPNGASLSSVLRAGGWRAAHPPSGTAMLRLLREGLKDQNAPPAPLFWKERLYTLAFNRVEGSATGPRVLTVVLWRTAYREQRGWLWVGVVRAYDGMHWYPARRLAPDLDAARQRLVDGLLRRGCVQSVQSLAWVEPQTGQSFVDDAFFTQGRLALLRLADVCSGGKG